MKRYDVVFADRAEAHLREIEAYIGREAGRPIARRYIDGIIAKCMSLEHWPSRGTPRDDLVTGLRTVPFRRRTMIAYLIEDERVTIIAVYYGGQDFEADFRDRQS